MNVKRAVLGALIVLTPTTAGGEETYGLPRGDAKTLGMSAERLASIPTKLEPFVEEGKLAGLVTVVARDGKVVHFEAFGSMDVERRKPMAPDTIFRMYSMTKPITGAAVMILVDEGKLSLSDPVSKYIPEFGGARVLIEGTEGEAGPDGEGGSVPAKVPMTIWHLMTHTSGLTYGGADSTLSRMYSAGGVDSSGDSGLTLEELAQKVAAIPLLFEPGTRWNYGVSMDILGRVVEVITGQRFGDFLEARIFSPLGMKDSGFYVPEEKIGRFAANYGPGEDGLRLVDDPETSPYRKIPSQDSGGGGMVGTAADYLRFAQMLLNGGELDGVRILRQESVEEMTTNQLPPELGEAPLNLMPGVVFRGVGFGYCGAAVIEGHEKTLFGPAGIYSWGGAASTDFWIDRNERLVGMVLTQFMPTATYPTRAIVLDGVYDALEVSYRPTAASAQAPRVKPSLQAQVQDTERAFARTMAERDHHAFTAYLADEAVFFGGQTVLRGKAAVAAGWKPFFDGPQAPFSWEPQVVEVLESGTLALSSGPVKDPQGKIVGTFNSIWRREGDGRWRIVFDKGCN